MKQSIGFTKTRFSSLGIIAGVALMLGSCFGISSSISSSTTSSSSSSSTSTSSSSSSSESSSSSSSSSSIADIPVTSIVVTGAGGATTITTLHGTLQMTATVSPVNATDDSVTWTVANLTGSATINTTGLLTAVADGDVRVRAQSVSQTLISGYLTITLSNQPATSKVLLVSTISEAQLNKDSVVVSTDGSDIAPANQWVTQSVMDTFIAAIAAAQVVVANANATQAVVDAAVVTLVAANTVFNNAKSFGTLVIEGINLGTSINYAVLAKAAITTSGASVIEGDVGISPAASTYMTGFSLSHDTSGMFATSSQVNGTLYASNHLAPTPEILTTAVSDMETAYNSGMEVVPSSYVEMHAGDLSGKTLTSGVYKWSTNVVINTDVTISGTATDVWIFQISGTLTQAANIDVLLVGGALADNIYWVVTDVVTIGAGAHFEGVILAQTAITMGVNASINGRLLAQTAVTLADVTVNTTVIDATEINVRAEGQATTITVTGGTLQMSVEVLPSNASNKLVIWSVEDGTGSATMSPLGLLTAVSDGTVIVKATAVNDPTLFGVKTITLSNQLALAKDILIDDIAEAILNHDSVVVSVDGTDILPDVHWVTAAVLAAFDSAITLAQAVVDDLAATQVEVDDAVLDLATASETFNNAKAFGTFVEAVMPVHLGTAGDFGVLAKSAISTTGGTYVTGTLGLSPAAASFITGFDLIADASNTFSTSIYASGHIYAADYADPTPAYLTTAVSDMELAYTEGMGLAPDATELYAGDLSGQTLVGGVYKWSNDVLISSELTLSGSAADTWVFQISGKLTQAENINITLAGGALAENIFWIVADTAAIGVGAHFEGNLINQVNISMGTGSSINGRLLAQTAITLDATTVVKPA